MGALVLDRVPETAIVLGGGVIGVEFASVWTSFGTSVTIEIYRDADFLEAPATVAYFTSERAMGLAFTGMEPRFAAVLKKWLASTSIPKTLTH